MAQFISQVCGGSKGPGCGDIEVTNRRDPTDRPETPIEPLSTVPFRRDRDYVDRGTILDQVQEKTSMPGARVALVGLGGVG